MDRLIHFFVFVEEYDIISDVNFKYERENERLWNY